MLPTVFFQQHVTSSILPLSTSYSQHSVNIASNTYQQHFTSSISSLAFFEIPYWEHHLQAAFYHTSIFPVPLYQQHFASILLLLLCHHFASILQVLPASFCQENFTSSIYPAAYCQ